MTFEINTTWLYVSAAAVVIYAAAKTFVHRLNLIQRELQELDDKQYRQAKERDEVRRREKEAEQQQEKERQIKALPGIWNGIFQQCKSLRSTACAFDYLIKCCNDLDATGRLAKKAHPITVEGIDLFICKRSWDNGQSAVISRRLIEFVPASTTIQDYANFLKVVTKVRDWARIACFERPLTMGKRMLLDDIQELNNLLPNIKNEDSKATIANWQQVQT